ncbi:modification methylase [Aliarcobacter trophiarum LMG 25534]|uniref:Modification methylase n=2 Tax=Aliarcobacter trophiarum TaxID=708186 RepID=A0AAD0QKK6_9BACT|nr:adenine-specific methyltransferase EcoRI family protein [Aliarcobacter trophiarum]AXK49692.1 type II adenine-specific DNA methyltransferase (EcoRI methylase domain) [Aliarcobacter trophiarum LMG 25534]RXI25750.1 modification methylase [Aliarcobacter trophiarum]RXJ89592.1 modification methylase [Aliarcobacter trophiarum LMG 25534]
MTKLNKKDLNKNLHKAKINKEDEYYTQLTDIEKELKHYKKHFKDKIIYCNCDDPRVSNFFHYFSYNFEKLGLKKLITTCFQNNNMDLFTQGNSKQAIYLEYYGDKNGNSIPDIQEIGVNYLEGDGDFRSEESIELLKQADIVVTNPPFSLFREYIAQLIEYDKKFIIIGNQNAATTKETFSLIKENKIWLGNRSGDMEFKVPNHYQARETRYREDETGQKWRSLGNICWYTNLDIAKRHEDLILYKLYKNEEYPTYENYNAINIDKVAEIPIDYGGVMGVPVTFLSKYNPEQFEIVGQTHSGDSSKEVELLRTNDKKRHRGIINGKQKYARILIRNKKL